MLTFALSALLTASPRGQDGAAQVFSTSKGEAQNVRFVVLANAQVQIDYDLVSSDRYLENSRVVSFAAGGSDTLTVTPTPGQPPMVKAEGQGGSKAKWLIPLGRQPAERRPSEPKQRRRK